MNKLAVTISVAFFLAAVGGAYYLGTKSPDTDLRAAQAVVTAISAPRVGDSSTTPTVPSVVINIKKGLFDPAIVTVKKNETVIWMNTDAVAHTVTSDEGGIVLNSQSISAAHSFAHTFTDAGTFTYHCAIDRAMRGTIIVKE